jgi:ABC-type dipeptide/oligopeptide/nickel transport system permease component/ABC-type transport system substrate-binding protein
MRAPRPRRAAAAVRALALLCTFLSLSAVAEDTLTIGLQLEPPVLDPTASPAAAISEVTAGNLFESLVRFDADGEAVACLADRWQISDDGLDYVFHLRSGVRFHDGSPFDARIAKFSLDRARDPNSSNPQKARLSAVREISVIDAQTLRMRLSRRSGSLLQSLAWTAFAMVSPTTVGQNAVHPVGTGPFKFGAWRRGDAIELIRNDDYWGERAPLARAVFKFISEPAAAYAALMAGDVQAFPNYPAPESLAQFKADPRFSVYVGSTEGETILALNNRKAPFNDVRVRRAVSYAVDRAAIIDGAMYGYGIPIGSHFPPRSPAAVDLTGLYRHSPAEAMTLLARAGYANGFSVTLKLPPPAYARRGGEIIAAQLAAVGIKARIENIEWAQWLDQVFSRHDFDMTVIQHAEPMDYDIYGRDDYYFGYRSDEVKSLLAQLEDQIAAADRKRTLAAIQRRIAGDAVNTFLFQYPKLSVYDRHLAALGLENPLNATDLSRARFDRPRLRDAVQRDLSVSPASPPRWMFPLIAALMVLLARRFGPWAVGRRLLALAAMLAASSAVIFAIVQIAPGDPAQFMLGLQADPHTVAALRHDLGLDGSAIHRYVDWIAGCVRGDFGTSYTYRVPVGSLIAERIQVSVPLALYALILTVLVSFPVGLIGAASRGRPAGGLVSAATRLGIAIPNYWLGILLVLVFAIDLRWVSAGGFPGWDGGFWPAMKALTLPAIALGLPQTAILARVLRAALLDTLQEDFIRTARSKGLSGRSALLRHALPNALIPVLTVLGMQFSFLLAGGVIVENVFFLPGLGRLVFQAIVQRDLMVVQSVVMLLVFAVVLVSFLVDLSYVWIDPRLRETARE